ncbi:MAG: ABC transporter substrate-binding protein [Rhodospirillaceae bacterium]|nr:ABC transporter substrate-binding protein [Rhodospirillaceae bacterium]
MALVAFNSAAADTLRVATPLMPITAGNPYGPVSLPQALPAQMIYDPLTVLKGAGEVGPGLAVSWAQEGPATWVFQLARDVVFSNGEPFDATAVVDAFAYLATPEGKRDSSANMDVSQEIDSVRARDSYTVEIKTKAANPILPLHLSFLRIPAPRQWRTAGRDSFIRNPVGTGPFKVDQWQDGRINLSANSTACRKAQALKADIRVIAEPASRLQALASGAVDVAISLSAQDKTIVEAMGAVFVSRPAPKIEFMAFVTVKDSPLHDVRVRQALNYAVNKQAMIAALIDGATQPASQFSHDGAFGFNPDLSAYPYDPARARALLKDAGYAKGFEFTVLIDPATSGYAEFYQQIAQDLSAVGVRMNVRATPTTRIAESVQSAQWPAEAFGWTFTGFDSLRGYLFRSCKWHHPYHCDTAMMPLINKAAAAATVRERQAATRAALAYERDNPPGVLLWRGVNFDAVSPQVKGYSAVEDVVAWEKIKVEQIETNP